MSPQARAALRRSLRQLRCQLGPRQQGDAAVRLFHRIAGKRFFRSARRIAFYLPNDGEIDPSLLLAAALGRGQHCYLPVIHPQGKSSLLFVRFRTGDTLKANRWGIYEPVLRSATQVSARALDLVFVPLVGFDVNCNRLGMGQGFYDRSFGFLVDACRKTPKLVGLAHDCQRVGDLSPQAWDIKMAAVVSDQHTYQPRPVR
jgi:5-formyltetrahydrofolate cyclo-ligase